jgi:hypothetical protein
MRRGCFTAPRGAPTAPLRQTRNKRSGFAFPVFVAASIGLLAFSTAGLALELPKPEPVAKYLGKAATGPNYTVQPLVRSDGVMRIFDVDTPYGQFAFDGIEFAKLRIHELNAIAALEKMSQSEEFGKAFGRTALAPIKFGADLITNPAGTVERSLSGIGNMFDRFGAGLSNNRADRDGLVDSLLGVSDMQRELAVDLDVDPYTDFAPLAQKLKDMAGVMAGGTLPIKAALSFVPGGIGIAVSSVATVSDARDTLRSKTAAQVIAETRANLLGLGIPDETVSRLVENRNYTPADLLIMSLALKKLNAENTTAFVDHVAGASTRNVAFYHRRRAQILAARSSELGGLVSFVTFGGQPINLARNGNVVAAFTVDDIAWTEVQQRTFIAATSEMQRMKPGAVPVLATTGAVTPMAAAEIGQRGWKIVHIKP